jgi:hypothetical protein
MLWKCWSISQGAANRADGEPQYEGVGLPLVMSDGMLPRGKNQMLIAVLVHSVAYTPPPLALKPDPYDRVSVDLIPQPTFVPWPGALTSQFAVSRVPVKPLLEIEHPGLV